MPLQLAGGIETLCLRFDPQAKQILRRFLPGEPNLLVAHIA
jgi:hypothetical protein